MFRLDQPVTMMISSIPALTASSTTYWMIGLSTIGSISLGKALVWGKNRVPNPAAGITAFLIFIYLIKLNTTLFQQLEAIVICPGYICQTDQGLAFNR